MRLIVLIAGLVLAANVLAEEKPKTVSTTKQLDKSSPQLMSTGSSGDSSSEVVSPRDAASGMATGKRQHAAAPGDGDDNSGDADERTAPANHNTTRANRTLDAAPTDDGESGGQTRAQDYNSSRSNTTSARLDEDSDGDSLGKETRCSMRNDECVSDDNDPVVRKKPGRK